MRDWGQRRRIALAAPVALALLATAYAIGDAVLAPAPAATSPSFVDTLLASRAVVAAIRVALISASGFVVASVIALAARRQWLTRVGPVRVSEVAGFSDETEHLEALLVDAEKTIARQRADIREASRLLDRTELGEERAE